MILLLRCLEDHLVPPPGAELLKAYLHVQVASRSRHLEEESLRACLHIQVASRLRHLEEESLKACLHVQEASRSHHLEEELPWAFQFMEVYQSGNQAHPQSLPPLEVKLAKVAHGKENL